MTCSVKLTSIISFLTEYSDNSWTDFSSIIIDEKSIQELSEYSKRKEEIEVDLNEQVILYGNKKLTFDIEPAKKKRLLEGLDNIGLSLKKIPNIEKFENSMNKTKPWI